MFLNKPIGAILVSVMVLMTGCSTQPPITARPATVTTVDQEMTPREPTRLQPEDQAQREYEQALASVDAGHVKTARQQLTELTRSYPTLSGPYANLGILSLREGNMEAAENYLTTAVQINPKNAMAFNQLGILYRQTGRFDEARQAYTTALEIDPDYANAHLNLGILFDLFLQDTVQALQHYERYLELVHDDDEKVSLWLADLKQRIANNSVSTNEIK